MVITLLPKRVQVGALQKLSGIDLDLVRTEALPQADEIDVVGFEGGAQQVGHPVQYDLETGGTQGGTGLQRFGDGVAALVQGQDVFIQALGTHLHLGDAQGPQAR